MGNPTHLINKDHNVADDIRMREDGVPNGVDKVDDDRFLMLEHRVVLFF